MARAETCVHGAEHVRRWTCRETRLLPTPRYLEVGSRSLDTIDVTPTRPEHVLLVFEVVSPGPETTDRIVKADQYARAGIQFYWRFEQAATGAPLVYTYVLDPSTGRYRDGEIFTGAVKVTAPFSVEVDLGQL